MLLFVFLFYFLPRINRSAQKCAQFRNHNLTFKTILSSPNKPSYVNLNYPTYSQNELLHTFQTYYLLSASLSLCVLFLLPKTTFLHLGQSSKTTFKVYLNWYLFYTSLTLHLASPLFSLLSLKYSAHWIQSRMICALFSLFWASKALPTFHILLPLFVFSVYNTFNWNIIKILYVCLFEETALWEIWLTLCHLGEIFAHWENCLREENYNAKIP